MRGRCPHNPAMPHFEASDGCRLHYDLRGEEDAPPVVLLHGFTNDLRMWTPCAGSLCDDYRVLAVDLRGHGRSDAPADLDSYTMKRYVHDVLELADELGFDIFGLVGCSFGGMIAAQLACEAPGRVAALVLSDASAAYEHADYAEAYREREAAMLRSEEVVERFGPAELGKRAAAGISDDFLANALRGRYNQLSRSGYLGAARVRRERPNLLPLLGERLTMPVLICTGDQDPAKSASEVMARHIPGARVVTFRNTGHGIPSLRPDAFADTVLAFFADVEEHRPVAGRHTV